MIETGSIRKMGAVSYSPSLVTFVPRISPQLNRLRPKFREHCRPLTSACVPTLLRFGWGVPNLFRKESKKVNTLSASVPLSMALVYFNPLMGIMNYSAALKNMQLVH